jgi:2-isopropylmalate synthase
MRPEDVGLTESTLAMGKHSGRHALKSKLSDLGIDVGDNQLKELFVRFKALADRKKEVYDDDILALVEQQSADAAAEHIKLKFLRVICGTEAPQSADIILEIEGQDHSVTAQGDGPVDAAFNAIKALVPHEARLELYQVHAVTEGTDAQATVSVRMREGGHIASAQASDTDTVVASARAYVQTLNRLRVRAEKSAPVSIVS